MGYGRKNKKIASHAASQTGARTVLNSLLAICFRRLAPALLRRLFVVNTHVGNICFWFLHNYDSEYDS